MKYYISDTHFFHENIIKICNRPYKDLEHMHQDIITKWNNKINKDDEVYILGDLSYKREDIKLLASLIKSLNGKKYLIKGNHDVKWLKSYYNQTNETLFENISDYLEIQDENKQIILFHYPIEDWNGMYHNSIHLFGHIHNSTNFIRQIPNRYNVGVDVNNFEPMTLKELIKRNQ